MTTAERRAAVLQQLALPERLLLPARWLPITASAVRSSCRIWRSYGHHAPRDHFHCTRLCAGAA